MAETRFHALLKARVLEQISQSSESLCSGAAKDYAIYRDMVGYIRGLNDALKFCDEIEGEFDQ